MARNIAMTVAQLLSRVVCKLIQLCICKCALFTGVIACVYFCISHALSNMSVKTIDEVLTLE